MKPTTKEQWESLHAQDRFRPKYPSERVVQWASTLPKGAKVLDHGCGAGRHSRFLTQEGFWVKPYDISLVYSLATDQFPTDTDFDAVLSYGVLYYLPPVERAQEIIKLHSLLKPGGLGLFIIRSEYYNRTSMLDVDIPQWPMSITEIHKEFAVFGSYEINVRTQSVKHTTEVEHDWVIEVVK